MNFHIPINEAKEGESQTVAIVRTGTENARANKRILRSYFKQVGVPANEIKRVMKAMNFWGKELGV